jgi:hypothetical protein
MRKKPEPARLSRETLDRNRMTPYTTSDRHDTTVEKGRGMPNGTGEIKVKLQDQLVGGVYANGLQISHTREEFIMDFLMIAPPTGTVTARVITSPGHMKRILSAMAENIKRYEEKFGQIRQADEPSPHGSIGFVSGGKS